MNAVRIFRHRRFDDLFSAYLNSNLIDARDGNEILFLAETVVVSALQQGVPTDEIIEVLEYALKNWGPDVVDQFSSANDGDWGFDAYHEALLKSVVEKMLTAAQVERSRAFI